MSLGLRKLFAVGVVAVAPLTLVACGGDDDDASGGGNLRQQVIDKMTEDGDEAGPTPEQAGCIADGLIASLGNQRIAELLALPDDFEIEDELTPDEQTKFASTAVGCIDARAMVIAELTGGGMSDEDANCVVDAIGEDDLEAMLEANMSGGTPDQSAIAEAVMSCGVG